MLQLFRNVNPFTVLILLFFTLLVKLQVLLHPVMPLPIEGHFVYNAILRWVGNIVGGSAFGYILLAVVLQFAQALYLNNITIRHKLYPRATYIPAFVFLLFTSIYPAFNYFSVTLLINWFILGGIDTLLSFNQTVQPRKVIFNSGFLLCIATLLQFPAIAYLLLLFAGLIVLRPFSLGEWVVGIMGYFTPLYFFVGILFLVDRTGILPAWIHVNLLLPKLVVSRLYLIGLVSGFTILVPAGLYGMQQFVPKSSIYIRRNWLALVFYIVISICVAVFTEVITPSAWLVAIPALSLVITHAFYLEKSKRFSNFILYFSLLFLVFCQLTINH